MKANILIALVASTQSLKIQGFCDYHLSADGSKCEKKTAGSCQEPIGGVPEVEDCPERSLLSQVCVDSDGKAGPCVAQKK